MAAAEGWNDEDWARLRTMEGLGMVLVPVCAPDHTAEWAGCRSPGKVPIDLATGHHMREWTARRGSVSGLDLDGFRRVQESRARMGRAPFGVGVLTGRPLADGRRLVSLDMDGAEGLADAKRLLGPARAPTMAYRTGSGGWHFLYAVPGDGPVPSRSDDGGHQGMALQGDGRQTVVPPSVPVR